MNRSLTNSLLMAIVLTAFRPQAKAQTFSNDEGTLEANFAARVVLLDEFIHRFNNDSSSEIRRYYEGHHRPFNKSRAQLIRSLFNYSTQRWDSSMVDDFIRTATDRDNPELLGFLADGWYAEADCRFLYNAVEHSIRLILRIHVNPDNSSRWMIVAVKPDVILAEPPTVPVIPRKARDRLFIQPTANDTYFSELDRIFDDKSRLTDLFEPGFMQRRNSVGFYQGLLDNRLKFVAVRHLKYHYFQVHHWIFTVEEFVRQSRNSGWLISSIRPVDEDQKSAYEKKLLED